MSRFRVHFGLREHFYSYSTWPSVNTSSHCKQVARHAAHWWLLWEVGLLIIFAGSSLPATSIAIANHGSHYHSYCTLYTHTHIHTLTHTHTHTRHTHPHTPTHTHIHTHTHTHTHIHTQTHTHTHTHSPSSWVALIGWQTVSGQDLSQTSRTGGSKCWPLQHSGHTPEEDQPSAQTELQLVCSIRERR